MRDQVFTVRLSIQEREWLLQIARKEERNPSDIVRRLIRQASEYQVVSSNSILALNGPQQNRPIRNQLEDMTLHIHNRRDL